MTEFILTKNNCTCRTKLLAIVRILRKLGWKVKVSTLGELL